MDIRTLSLDDVEAMWAINEEGYRNGAGLSQELAALLDLASYSIGAFHDGEMLGFVICLPPATAYGSLNYAWFNQRYEAFLYVDRIAVAEAQRNKGVGSRLYEQVARHAGEQNIGGSRGKFGASEPRLGAVPPPIWLRRSGCASPREESGDDVHARALMILGGMVVDTTEFNLDEINPALHQPAHRYRAQDGHASIG